MFNVLSVASGDCIEFPLAQGVWVKLNAALGPAEGQVQQCGLPGHQRRQCPHLVLVGQGMVSHASLVGPPSPVVLHTISLEHFNAPVVHPHRQRYPQVAPRFTQHQACPGVQPEPRGRSLEVEHYVFLGAAVFSCGSHKTSGNPLFGR